jgi:glycosyltransferase involved in cell wall biosynthesis
MPATPRPDAPRPWIVMQAGRGRGWGGEIRRARIFQRLAERTDARVVDDWPMFQRAVRGRRWQAWLPNRRPRPLLAASEGASPAWIDRIVALSEPIAVAIYDDAVAQSRALGLNLSPEREAELRLRRQRNEDAFRWHVVPTAAFAAAHGLDPDRIIVGGQGTVASHVRPGPWPDRPAVGMVSGAAPGRGIEALVEAMRLVREHVPDARLYLWLISTTTADDAYLDNLRTSVARDDWIEIGAAPYEELGETLAKATVLTIPHPDIEYMNVILPVKLFDSLAAGRPLVVTPRRETVAIVEPNGAGLISADDSPAALADPIVRLLSDDALARRMGAAGRVLAEREYDWTVLGDRIADEIFRREGIDPV